MPKTRPTTRHHCRIPAAVLAASLAILPPAHASPPRLKLVPVAENAFTSPVAITHAGDGSGRLFVTDQRGTVHIIDAAGQVAAEPFLDISARLVPERRGYDERGLLSVAFHPDYPNNGKFYAYYSAPSPDAPGSDDEPVDHQSVVAEFTVSADPDRADASSGRVVLAFNQPQFNHDGGQLAFGPDGLLYISTGDGGGSNDNDAGHSGGSVDKPDGGLGNAQDLGKLLGKILRIDPLGDGAPGGQYGIPAGNPFAAPDDGARDEIFAYGLRNPWRFSFDRQTGELFCADVGQGKIEEINLIGAGKNYGWRRFEGASDFDPTAATTGATFEPPIAQYAHPNAAIPGLQNIGISVTGGFVYRGSLIPDLAGTYIFGDWSRSFAAPSGTLLALEPDGAGGFDLVTLDIESGNPLGYYLPAIGEDEAGEIYVATKMVLSPSANDPASGRPTGGIFKIAALARGPATSGSVTLNPAADTTIYAEGNLANGSGIFLFSGHTNTSAEGAERRALLKFDVANAVPSGATIDAASVSIRMSKAPGFDAADSDFGLHRISQDWGEGTVNASGSEGTGGNATTGSATWTSTALNSGPDWTTPGGDFDPAPSASVAIATALGRYEWSSPAMAADVQGWLGDPASNFGWMLFSASDALASARRFDSSESTTAANRPRLTIDYSVPGAILTHRENWLAQFYPGGGFPGDLSDADLDSRNALLEYGFGNDPTVADYSPEAFVARFDQAGAEFIIAFIRDPRASDLTYTLQASADLRAWTDIATSRGGAATTGEGTAGVREANLLGRHPLKSVTVRMPGIFPGKTRQHFRLQLSRG